MASSKPIFLISIKTLADLVRKFNNNKDALTNSEIDTLKNHEAFSEDSVAMHNRSQILAKEGNHSGGGVRTESRVNSFLKATHYKEELKRIALEQEKGKDIVEDEEDYKEADTGSDQEKEMSSSAHRSLAVKDIQDVNEFRKCITRESYTIDSKAIEAHLLKFLETVPIDDEGYLTKEIKVYIYDNEDINAISIIGAGTKILDAFLYLSMRGSPNSEGLFDIVKVSSLSAKSVAKNIQDAKRAIQAAAILVYIQGSLPKNVVVEGKQVPKFISEKIYKGEISGLHLIGKQLSSASTEKFPAKVFLNVDINKFPTPIATRAKLSIAGNKAIRYAVFAGTCEKMEKHNMTDRMNSAQIAQTMFLNNRIEAAINIADFLRGLSGNIEAQLRMHPLSSERPVVKNLLLKMTRAIIESLSYNGRTKLFEKMTKANNKAFLNDLNLAGEEIGGGRIWKILDNEEADFMDMNIPTMKSIYKVT